MIHYIFFFKLIYHLPQTFSLRYSSSFPLLLLLFVQLYHCHSCHSAINQSLILNQFWGYFNCWKTKTNNDNKTDLQSELSSLINVHNLLHLLFNFWWVMGLGSYHSNFFYHFTIYTFQYFCILFSFIFFNIPN